MALQGTPSIGLDGGAKPLAASDIAAGWITLGATDNVTVTLPRTGRELAFLGPALLEPCVGSDETWLVRGRVQGTRGSGEAPGAEQWVVTPFGVVRYGTAIVEVAVSVEEAAVRASLKGGSATILPEGATEWQRLSTASPLVVKGAPLGKAGSVTATDRCARATDAARQLEDALLLPDATTSPGFGDLAMHANDAHVLAHACCSVAKLRADAASAVPSR